MSRLALSKLVSILIDLKIQPRHRCSRLLLRCQDTISSPTYQCDPDSCDFRNTKVDICRHLSTEERNKPGLDDKFAQHWSSIITTRRALYRINFVQKRPSEPQMRGSCRFCMSDYQIAVTIWQNLGDGGRQAGLSCGAARTPNNKAWKALVGGDTVRELQYPRGEVREAFESSEGSRVIDLAHSEPNM